MNKSCRYMVYKLLTPYGAPFKLATEGRLSILKYTAYHRKPDAIRCAGVVFGLGTLFETAIIVACEGLRGLTLPRPCLQPDLDQPPDC